MSSFIHLQIRRQGSVEYLVLNRPEVRNAFNEEMFVEMTAWADGAARDTSLRAVVMSGAGPLFCAGGDLTWMSKVVGYVTVAARMFQAFDMLPMPLIARIHGGAFGGGAGLAAVADIAVADTDAAFGFSEVRLGLLPAIIAPYVLTKIGRSAARELFLTGRRFTAERALQIGLVHAVVGTDRLDATVQTYVDDILASGPEAVAAAKALIRLVADSSMDAAVPLTIEALAARRSSAEAQERMRRFLKKS
jgi:methylglutaconyl-CoA hydratase